MQTTNNKKWFLIAFSTFLLCLPLFNPIQWNHQGTNYAYAADPSSAEKSIITVNGQGELTIAPDIAYVNIGVQTEGSTANEAQMKNATAFHELEKVLYETYNLDKKDVKTTNFSVHPEYSYTDRDPKIKGYNASQMLQITIRDLDKLGTFLDAVSQAGANRIHGIQFSTEKGQEYELQVITKAMENAQAKAQTIANFAGKQLKGIVNVSQGGHSGIPMQRANFAMMDTGAMYSEAAISTSIAAGELKITTTLTVQYEF